MSDTFYLADEDDPEVVLFSDFVALLGITPVFPGTFSPEKGASLEASWDQWRSNWFSLHLADAFSSVFQLATAQKVNEIAEIDLKLEKVFSEELSEKSRTASRAFLEGKSEMQANREWLRFTKLIEKGKTPGHLTTLFAFQSALYHLPLASALRSYARYEFCCGRSAASRLKPAEENQIFQRILPDLTVAVSPDISDDSGTKHHLRAI